MMNEIYGIKKSNTIKNIKIQKFNGNKIIVVNYLDGTKDHFDLNEENYNKLIDKMELQAKDYVDNKEKTRQIAKSSETKNLISGLGITASLCVASVLLNGIGADPMIVNAAFLSGLITFPVTVFSVVKIKNRANEDIKKYEMFLNNQEELQVEYGKLVSLEKQLGNKKVKNEQIDITTIDQYSYNELADTLSKLDRYKEIEEDIQPKVKTLKK